MALIPSAKYPGQVLTTDPTGYPLGKARNEVTEGDGTGTPWEEALANDLWGFHQALLDAAGVTASGNPDKVQASQYLDALNALFEPLQGGRDLQSWLGAAENASNGIIEPRGIAWQQENLVWIAVGSTDEAMISYDDGLTWQDDSGGMSTSLGLVDVAHSRANDIWVAVGNDDDNYTRTGISGAWGTTALPGGSTVSIENIVYDPLNDLFIAIGNTTGPTAAYIATSPGSALSWTNRTANVTASFTSDVIGSHAVSEAGVSVIAGVNAAHTTLMRSTDGLTWADVTTVLASDFYTVGYNPSLDKFLALGLSLGNVYTSSDGDSWTLVGPAALPLNAQTIRAERMVGSLGDIWVVGMNVDSIARVFYATDDADLTATGWDVQAISALGLRIDSMGFSEDGANGKVLAGIEPSTRATIYGSLRASPM